MAAKAFVVHFSAAKPSKEPFYRYPDCLSTSQSLPLKSLSVNKPAGKLNNVLFISHYTLATLHRRLSPVSAGDSDVPHPFHQESANFRSNKAFEEWNSLTAKFSGAANIPFMLLQLPQIILNARNLLAGNKAALLAVPWLVRKQQEFVIFESIVYKFFLLLQGMLTGLLGNLSLLSYFIKKREKEAIVVQTLGVVSTYVVISQLAVGEAMPMPHFIAISVVVATGLVLNFLNYFNMLNTGLWRFWEDVITVGGLTALPQVIWSTFVPTIPNSILPGTIAFVVGVATVVMARMGKLSKQGVKFVRAISGWTATLLFMWMPVSQMWTNFLNPDNIKGLSASSMLLAMIGNGLLIPRALFIRDFMWFTGSSWATLFYGYGNLVCLYCSNVISKEFFLAATAGLVSWIGIALWRDTIAYGFNSPLRSLKELVYGQ
ncbi:maltose excess protein 1, chloroplastic-like isoform X1 [Citrus sinensis]|uniref:maltose excess protein 1, chloroplastic-like isoform X1 n=1 Tax=Citrus sinensis TaxID=2711 RepID=UPI0003D752F9|nr:maltose excess protein 1, chloroplastic-like isoform X1 [Citrus sinensis]